MPFSATLYEELEKLDSSTRRILIKVLKEIEFNIGELVTRRDFNELKEQVSKLTVSVQELTEAQKKTDKTVKELAEAQKKTDKTVKELVEAQKKTEQRLEALALRFDELAEAQKKTDKTVKELVEAQKKTEQRLEALALRFDELAEAQKKTEQRLEALALRFDELAEAQKKTEQRLEALALRFDELAEAQKKTEQRLEALALRFDELAEAQKKTEQAILELTKGLKETREQLGGLSDTVGYTLENEAYKALPNLLKRDYGLEVEGRLKRGYLKDKRGKKIEVNILGKARKNGREVTIIGESKVRLSKKVIKEFIEVRLKNFESLYGEIFPLLVTHMISEPDAEEFAKEKGIALYYSYDF